MDGRGRWHAIAWKFRVRACSAVGDICRGFLKAVAGRVEIFEMITCDDVMLNSHSPRIRVRATTSVHALSAIGTDPL